MNNRKNLNYNRINNVFGWLAFAIATATYFCTLEPTASLWDCGEFISTAFGLEVGHPPGAPFFMIMARFFSIFSPSPDKVALMVNAMSGLASGFTILFLFWTITHLAKKILFKKDEEISLGKTIAIMGAGLTGSLAYAFSDTFWFSAVEAEVYASSSLFTAVVFWCILKWENSANDKHSNKWLILISYLMGLSIGVHLLNLLAIPAIVFVYYFKKYNPTKKGIISALGISIIILAVIMYGVIPGVIKVASWFELAFVNGIGMPFNSGVIVYAIIVISAIIWGIRYTIKHNKVIANTIITCFMMILIGYSSFAMVVIRSISNPPIDENNPDNVFSLLSYLNREQYGDRPLFFGQYYNAPLVDVTKGAPVYIKQDGKYKVAYHKNNYTYDSRFTTIFPRMYSDNQSHISAYKYWGGNSKGTPINVNGKTIYKPSFVNNLKFFFRYQFGHMYFRYFMWNFSGRQNDLQSNGQLNYGNWITGIPIVDKIMVGNEDKLPSVLKNNKARNKYYMLPFLLGLLGMIWQYKKSKKGKQDFWVVMLLFFFTGIAISMYLNQTPYQPRERDYAYAGSFYAFAIWIGLGVLAIFDKLNKKVNAKNSAIIASIGCLLLVPTLMACENWDDHDRSGRYATIAYAKNYLNSCKPDAILFTYGDNDTFPLWYAQEVEGVRRDIRIVNLSLLAGDWYITQMKRKAYEANGVPITFKEKEYIQGTRDVFAIYEQVEKEYNAREILDFIKSDDKETRLETQSGRLVDYSPTKHIFFPVDSSVLIANGQVKPENADKMVKQLDITLDREQYTKSDLMVFDMISKNNWERPIYFSIGMGQNSYLGFENYFQLEGSAYRIVPFKTKNDGYDFGVIDSDILYNNLMNKFEWGRIKEDDCLIDNFHLNTINVVKYRPTFARLATQLNEEGKHEKAIKALDKCMEELPTSKVTIDNTLIYFAQEYYNAGATEKANKLVKEVANNSYEHIVYYHSLSPSNYNLFKRDEKREVTIIQMLLSLLEEKKQKEVAREIKVKFESLYK